jgi:hypothetical protein
MMSLDEAVMAIRKSMKEQYLNGVDTDTVWETEFEEGRMEQLIQIIDDIVQSEIAKEKR